MARGLQASLPGRRPAPAGDAGDAAAPYQSVPVQILIFSVVAALSLGLGLTGGDSLVHGLAGHPWLLRAADVAFGVIAYVALWWRRRYPLAFAGYVIIIGVFSTLAGALSYMAAFTVAVHRNWPAALLTSSLIVATAWPSFLLYDHDPAARRRLMLFMFLTTVAVTGWGMFIRARRQLLASLRNRAKRAEESREQHALHARTAERQRIAREMHDVLAHRLSLLSVQAGALEFTTDASPQEVAGAAGAIRETTHQALKELRSVVRVLREDDENSTAAPQPVASDLPALIAESATTASVRMDFGAVDLAAIPADAGRTLYRIVQEGLTNARKHAAGSAVEVTLTGTPPDGLSLTITSWLPVDRAVHDKTPGSGTGLVGLRERAVLSGGRVDVTITDDDRFQLSAWLPWQAG
jgi:signal transduction histidine kinase